MYVRYFLVPRNDNVKINIKTKGNMKHILLPKLYWFEVWFCITLYLLIQFIESYTVEKF